MIEHQVFASATIGAAFAVIRRKLPIPSAVMPLQRPAFPPLDLRRHRPFWRALKQLLNEWSAATRQQPT